MRDKVGFHAHRRKGSCDAGCTQQVEAAERQGLTLDYLGGWQTFQPDQKVLERAWRVLYGIPDSMTYLLTCPQEQWEQVLLSWLGHPHERG